MVQFYSSGQPLDLVVLSQFLKDEGVLEEVGGDDYLADIYTFVPSPAAWEHYLQIVKDKSLLRTIVEFSKGAIEKCNNSSEFFSVEEILGRTQIKFGELKRFTIQEEKTIQDWADEKMSRIESGEPDSNVIITGLKELDEISPLRQGDMPIIKAMRKVGKSTLALTILENVSIKDRLPALYFSLEDRAPKVMDRILAGVARVPVDRHHIKKLTPKEQTMVSAAIAKIYDSKLVIEDSLFSLAPMLTRAKKMKIDCPDLALVVVDYAQLIHVEVKKNDTREREIATISRAWRQYAMETGVPVLLLSQVNKDGESRESRALEQDCTACWVLEEVENHPDQRDLFIEFQRDGESRVKFPLSFLGSLHRLENFAQEPI